LKPLYIDVSTLYSNTELLKRYDREVPKTWDDLIDTARDILKREKAKNGESDLIGYNGLLNGKYYIKYIYFIYFKSN